VIDMAGKKNRSGAPGTEGVAAAFDAEAARANGAKPVQTHLDLGDEVIEYQEIEIEVPVSAAEAVLLERQAAAAMVERARLQRELDDIKKEASEKAAEVKEQDNLAAARSKEAAERKRRQKQRVKVVYYPTRGTVRFLDPVSGEDVQMSRAMRPEEMTRLADPVPPPRVLDPPSGDAIDAEDGPGDAPAGDA
jgi:hypothetical protein